MMLELPQPLNVEMGYVRWEKLHPHVPWIAQLRPNCAVIPVSTRLMVSVMMAGLEQTLMNANWEVTAPTVELERRLAAATISQMVLALQVVAAIPIADPVPRLVPQESVVPTVAVGNADRVAHLDRSARSVVAPANVL